MLLPELPKKNMIVGITGCIGSGKSFLSAYLRSKGFLCFDSDLFVKEAYADQTILKKLAKNFDCLNSDETFNKEKLKQQLNDQNLSLLNAIIHPYVIQKIKDLRILYPKQIVFVEIPLLFEENLSDLCDYTIAIDCALSIRDRRLLQRDKENYPLMKKLEARQFSNEEKAKRADFVIVNREDDQFLFQQIEKLLIILINSDKI